MTKRILIGNSFSLSLIRKREVRIVECSLGELQSAVRAGAVVCSFWGHGNTLAAAERVVGFPLRPKTERPALVCAADGRPMFGDEIFDVCWVLSPDYVTGYRPPIGTEVDESKIVGWKLLKLTWKTKEENSDEC